MKQFCKVMTCAAVLCSSFVMMAEIKKQEVKKVDPVKATKSVVYGTVIACKQYYATYGRVPRAFEELTEDSKRNPREIKFLKNDVEPVDLFHKKPLKMLINVKDVEKGTKLQVKSYKVDKKSRTIIVYSFGPNGKDDKGIFDEKSGKDDMAVVIKF